MATTDHIARGIRLAPALDRLCLLAKTRREVVLYCWQGDFETKPPPPDLGPPLETWPVEVTP